jgi:hypothetical protein
MDFSLPILTTNYTEVLGIAKQDKLNLAKMLDGVTLANPSTGIKRWNSQGSRFEEFDGSTWTALSTLYEIKVRDSDKLNGKQASEYALATHAHNYASVIHTHNYADSSHNHNTAYLGKISKASDSFRLNGASESTSGTVNSIAKRDVAGDIAARLFRSTYENQTSVTYSAALCFRINNGANNYMRFATAAAVKNWLISNGAKLTDTNTYRSISNSVTSTSSSISASCKAVKTAYDKAVSAYNLAASKISSPKYTSVVRTSHSKRRENSWDSEYIYAPSGYQFVSIEGGRGNTQINSVSSTGTWVNVSNRGDENSTTYIYILWGK